MNRGSAAIGENIVLMDIGFNEAPIHESGKCRVFGRSRSRLRSFNEAPIHESGKSGTAWLLVGDATLLQ